MASSRTQTSLGGLQGVPGPPAQDPASLRPKLMSPALSWGPGPVTHPGSPCSPRSLHFHTHPSSHQVGRIAGQRSKRITSYPRTSAIPTRTSRGSLCAVMEGGGATFPLPPLRPWNRDTKDKTLIRVFKKRGGSGGWVGAASLRVFQQAGLIMVTTQHC